MSTCISNEHPSILAMAIECLGLGVTCRCLHMQSYGHADDAHDLHKMVDVHMLIIMYLIFMLTYHIRGACSVATAHTAKPGTEFMQRNPDIMATLHIETILLPWHTKRKCKRKA